MTYLTAAQTKKLSGTEKAAVAQRTLDVFYWPGLYNLSKVIDASWYPTEGPRRRGRKSPYPTAIMLGCWFAVRAVGSLAALVTELHSGLWEEVRAAVLKMDPTISYIPVVGPDRHKLEQFRNRLVDEEGLFEKLQDTFQKVALAQARHHGNLLPGVSPDWSKPNLENAIIGDGTVITPPTDVYLRKHPVTKKTIAVNSKAASPETARVARAMSDLREDGKTSLRGLNMVHWQTWTKYGRVVLATGTALRAEQWAALDLLDQLAAKAGDGIHCLIYDRVFNGWLVDYTMATHRIRTINKGVGRKKTS